MWSVGEREREGKKCEPFISTSSTAEYYFQLIFAIIIIIIIRFGFLFPKSLCKEVHLYHHFLLGLEGMQFYTHFSAQYTSLFLLTLETEN